MISTLEGNDHHTVAIVARFTYEDYLQIVNEDYNQNLGEIVEMIHEMIHEMDIL